MKEKAVYFLSDGLNLEGRLASCSCTKAAVITHPHPQMGGSMDNNVVMTMAETLFAEDYSTLRFNFRGAGRSQGTYSNGLGEQHDLVAAVAFVNKLGYDQILLAGYSFGAWIINQALAGDISASAILFVSPPVDFLPFDFTGCEGKISLLIAGDQDIYCPQTALQQIGKQLRCPVEIIHGTDHFYWGGEEQLSNVILKYFV
jgi:alpha/beta superfamily hydrolase